MYFGMFKLKGNTLQPPSAHKGCSLAGRNHRAAGERNLGGLSSRLCNKSRGAHEGFLSLHVVQAGMSRDSHGTSESQMSMLS